jgi:raffinose/stachyose/melibiose transport system substrate-binding protein
MKSTLLSGAALAAVLAAFAGSAHAETTLKIESWRSDDQAVWDEKIIPAFEKSHPDIKVVFAPTAPTEYNAALNARLDGGTAGDLIVCRPFDGSLALYKKGQLTDVTKLKGLENFSDVAKVAWTTDDGKETFCVPMASVIHGFMYNKEAFKEVGVDVPKTEAEFYAVLDKIKANGKYVPLDIGTSDQWEAATMGYYNIAPVYYGGEAGRDEMINGTAKMTDPKFVKGFEELAKWIPYLGNGYQAQSYSDSQNLFTLGRAAIYPTGSWEISGFKANADFEVGAFPPPVAKAGDKCVISDHTDIGIGMNAASKNKEAAQAFLEWVASPEFASIYTNELPGFFSLSSAPFEVKDPLAKEFISWRKTCDSSIRLSAQILSRGEPNMDNQMWVESANVLNGTETPAQAAEKIQQGLAAWYPLQK